MVLDVTPQGHKTEKARNTLQSWNPSKKNRKKSLTSSKEAKTCGPDNGSVPKLRKRPSCLEQGKPLRNLRLRSLWKTSAQRQKAALEKLQPPGKA